MAEESYQWSEERTALLGTMPDPDLANQLGIPLHRVVAKRLELGIPTFRSKKVNRLIPVWTPELDALIGNVPYSVLMEKYNIPIREIRKRRIDLGLEPPKNSPPKPAREWTLGEDALLGMMPDTTLAEQLSTTTEQVKLRRVHLGVEPYKRVTKYPFTEEQDALLGTMLDSDLAYSMGVERAIVGQRRRHLKIPSYKTRGQMVEISAEKLIARRLQLDILQKDMASTPSGRAPYIQLETGHTKLVSLGRLKKVAKILQCEASDLMPDVEDSTHSD